jgi:hypothetical protein
LLVLLILLVGRGSLISLLLLVLILCVVFGNVTFGGHGLTFTGHGIDWH